MRLTRFAASEPMPDASHQRAAISQRRDLVAQGHRAEFGRLNSAWSSPRPKVLRLTSFRAPKRPTDARCGWRRHSLWWRIHLALALGFVGRTWRRPAGHWRTTSQINSGTIQDSQMSAAPVPSSEKRRDLGNQPAQHECPHEHVATDDPGAMRVESPVSSCAQGHRCGAQPSHAQGGERPPYVVGLQEGHFE